MTSPLFFTNAILGSDLLLVTSGITLTVGSTNATYSTIQAALDSLNNKIFSGSSSAIATISVAMEKYSITSSIKCFHSQGEKIKIIGVGASGYYPNSITKTASYRKTCADTDFNLATGLITINSHGFSDGDLVYFPDNTPTAANTIESPNTGNFGTVLIDQVYSIVVNDSNSFYIKNYFNETQVSSFTSVSVGTYTIAKVKTTAAITIGFGSYPSNAADLCVQVSGYEGLGKPWLEAPHKVLTRDSDTQITIEYPAPSDQPTQGAGAFAFLPTVECNDCGGFYVDKGHRIGSIQKVIVCGYGGTFTSFAGAFVSDGEGSNIRLGVEACATKMPAMFGAANGGSIDCTSEGSGGIGSMSSFCGAIAFAGNGKLNIGNIRASATENFIGYLTNNSIINLNGAYLYYGGLGIICSQKSYIDLSFAWIKESTLGVACLDNSSANLDSTILSLCGAGVAASNDAYVNAGLSYVENSGLAYISSNGSKLS